MNDIITDSGYTERYIGALTTIVNTSETSENPIKFKLPNSSTISYNRQYQIPLHNLSRQAKNAEIFPALHSSLLSIEKLCEDECIVTFDKYSLMVIKDNKYIWKAITYFISIFDGQCF